MFDQKYSDADKAAMVLLAEQGLTAPQVAAQLAQHGYPPLEVSPFEAPESTVRKYVQQGRQKAAGETFSPLSSIREDAAVEELRRRVVTIADRETKRLARDQARGKLNGAQLLAMAKTVRELRPPTSKQSATKAPTKGETPSPGDDADSAFMAQLADDDAEQSASDPPQPPETPSLAPAPAPAPQLVD